MGKTRIQIVEDEGIIAKDIQGSLENLGYVVTSISSSGKEAIKKAEEEHPDLTLMDIVLRGDMDGIQTAQEICSRLDLPVVYLTAYADQEIIDRAKITGPFGYLLKPFEERELHVAIEMALYRHRLEKSLRENEEKFKRLSEASFEGIAITGEGKILDANKILAEMFGYDLSEVIGKQSSDFLAPGYLDVVTEKIASKYEKPYEIECRKKDGSTFPVEIHGKQTLYHGGEARVSALRDLTERKAAEEALKKAKEQAEEANKLKDKFVSLVSHDLRSPFASIYSFTKIVLGDHDHPLYPEHREIIERIQENSRRMLTMIEELLQISRLQTGNIVPKYTFMDARRTTVVALGSLDRLAKDKGIELVNAVPEGVRLYADLNLFSEVLTNLVSNAIKFCHEGDRVTIYIPPNKKATIAVEDTGVGIRPPLLPNLFVHEIKTTSTGTKGERGTGLGLPLSHDIMQAHGGSLTVEPTKGKGSIFYAELPYIKPRILLVDDDKISRRVAKKHMETLDVEIKEVENGREALKSIKNNPPHLILLDLEMPVMDGFEVLKHLEEKEETKRIPKIVITSNTEIESREKAFRLGASDFVSKPLTIEDLVPRVKRLIA